jgi:hypothetical protein
MCPVDAGDYCIVLERDNLTAAVAPAAYPTLGIVYARNDTAESLRDASGATKGVRRSPGIGAQVRALGKG